MRGILFRKEALESKKMPLYGSVVINAPMPAVLVTAGVAVFMLGLVLFFIFAEYSEKFQVKGYLNSLQGVLRIYPFKNGLIQRSLITQGMPVEKGQPLFVIDTEEALGHQLPKQQPELDHWYARQQALIQEMAYKEKELSQLRPLLTKHFIPRALFHQKERSLASMKNSKEALDLEIVKYKKAQSYTIYSPIKGRVSVLLFHEGEHVSPTQILAKILPDNADLIAEIFVPVPNAGFLQKNKAIMLQYDAYPALHFGHQKAIISDISFGIVTDKEEDKPMAIKGPYYKVWARLSSQGITLYGKKKPLLQGMTFSAWIKGPKKKLWQWILSPFISPNGKLMA